MIKLLFPQTKELTREVIKEEFFQKYYPEMKVRQGWWYIYGRYVMLQKNPFVCAKVTVKQNNKEGKTLVRIAKDQNVWAYIIGAPIIGHFIQGDFYKDLEVNFKKFLTKKYGLREDEIKKEKWSFKNFMKNIWAVLKWVLLFFALFAIIALIPNLIDNMRPRDFEDQATSTYETVLEDNNETVLEDDYEDEESFMSDDSGNLMKTKHIPSGKEFEGVCVLKEYNGYALCCHSDLSKTFMICNPEGEAIEVNRYADEDFFDVSYGLEFLTPEIIWVLSSHDDFIGLDGQPVHNLTVWAFKHKNDVHIFALIAAILTAAIFVFRKRKQKKNKISEATLSDETIME